MFGSESLEPPSASSVCLALTLSFSQLNEGNRTKMIQTRDGDSVRPSAKQIQDVLCRSQNAWLPLYRDAISQKQLPSSCANFSRLIRRVPALPNDSRTRSCQRSHLRRDIWPYSLIVQGCATWKFTGAPTCEISGTAKETSNRPLSLSLGTTKGATMIDLDGDTF